MRNHNLKLRRMDDPCPVRLGIAKVIPQCAKTTSLSFHSEGKLLIAASKMEDKITLLDCTGSVANNIRSSIQVRGKGVSSACFTYHHSTILVAARLEPTVSLHSLHDNSIIHRFSGGHSAPLVSVVQAPNADTFATTSKDASIRTWDARSGECISYIKTPGPGAPVIAYDPKGMVFATGTARGTIKLFDARAQDAAFAAFGVRGARADSPASLEFSSDGNRILHGAEAAVELDAYTGKIIRTLTDHAREGVTSPATISTDSRLTFAATSSGDMFIYDNASQLPSIHRAIHSSTTKLACNPRYNMIASSCASHLLLWI